MTITIKPRTCNFLNGQERAAHMAELLQKKQNFENAERNTDVFCHQLVFDNT